MRLPVLWIAACLSLSLFLFAPRIAEAQTCSTPGVCGAQAPSGCFCDNRCLQPGFHDCCSDIITACKAPSFTGLVPRVGSTAGGYSTNITGNHFDNQGTAGVSVLTEVTLGGSACPTTSIANTQLACTVPAGQGKANPVTVKTTWTTYLGTQVFTVTSPTSAQTFDYNPPSVTLLSPSPMPTVGGTLTLTGASMGLTGATVKVNNIACPVTSQTHTQIQCTMAAGVGANLPVIVTVAAQVSASVPISYTAPSITSIAGAHGTAGGSALTVNGDNFGPSAATLTVTVGGVACPVSSHTQTSATCTLPAGQGAVPVVVSVGGQSSPASIFTYDAPAITTVSPAVLPTTGGTLTLTGTNFGLSGTVTVGGNACPVTSYSHTQIVCTAPAGVGTGLTITVTSGGQSGSSTVSYAAPSLASVSAATKPTQGGVAVTLAGSNLGASGATVTVGGAPCPVTSQTHTQVRCTLPPGQGTGLAVVLSVGGQSSNTLSFAYDPPVITGLAPAAGPTSGGALTIDGANFGVFGATVTIDGVACPVTSSSHTTIVCTAPPGVGLDLPVVVTVAGQSSAPAFFDHLAPAITSLVPDHGPMAGGTTLTVNGSNFGASGATVTVDGNACAVTTQTQTQVQCTLPAGQGKNVPVVLTVGGQASAAALFDYDAAAISASPPSLAFGQVVIGSAGGDATLTLSDPGEVDLVVSGITVSGAAAADYSVTSPALPATVSAGGSRAFTVHFTPSAHGARAASLAIDSNALAQPTLVVAVSGTGIAPTINAGTAIAFGASNVGVGVNRTVTVGNTGERDLVLAQVSISGGDAGDFTVQTVMPVTITPGASKPLTLRFVPTSVGGRAASASIVSNDPLTPVASVALTGTGTSPAVAIAPASIDFGDVRIDAVGGPRPVTISNSGSGPLTITGVSLGGTGAADFTVSAVTLPAEIAPGGSLVLQLGYQPGAVGADVATLQVTCDDPTAASLEVALSGNGVSPALSVAPTSLDFGGQLVGRASSSRRVTITNDGTGTLGVTGLALTGTDAAAFTLGAVTLPAQVAPGASLQVGIVFTPTAVGSESATLAITTDAPAAPTADVALAGVGLSQVLAVSPLAIDFGVLEAPGSADAITLTVTNTSAESVTLDDGVLAGASASAFSVTGLAGALAPGASRSAQVGFSAAAAGNYTATLTIAATEPGLPDVVVPLAGKAVSSLVAIAPESLSFGAVELGSSATAQDVTVTNQSGGALTIDSITTTNDDFDVSGVTLPRSLAAGDSLVAQVSFTPSSVGAITGSIEVRIANQAAPEVTGQLSGEGTAVPAPDAGPGTPDAGPGTPDAGPSGADAAPGSPDAGPTTAGGGGCGCRVGGDQAPGAAWLGGGLLLGLALLTRRRRRS
jgi:MYXO-CTERM domain-containing protein